MNYWFVLRALGLVLFAWSFGIASLAIGGWTDGLAAAAFALFLLVLPRAEWLRQNEAERFPVARGFAYAGAMAVLVHGAYFLWFYSHHQPLFWVGVLAFAATAWAWDLVRDAATPKLETAMRVFTAVVVTGGLAYSLSLISLVPAVAGAIVAYWWLFLCSADYRLQPGLTKRIGIGLVLTALGLWLSPWL